MDVKDLFKQCIAQATAVVDRVRQDDFQRPTPDTEWNVRALLSHMMYELAWVPDVVAGKTIQEVGGAHDGDLIGQALAANWHALANQALDAVAAADPQLNVHLSYGESTAEAYIRENATDILIHAWDLAEGIGKPLRFPPEIARAVHDYLVVRKDSLQRSGLFAMPVDVPEDADPQTKLLAITGRSKTWAPAA